MKKGLFSEEFDFLNEIKVSLLTIVGFLITIINPIAWIVYILFYKMGKTVGNDLTTTKLNSQWGAFLIAVASYIVLIIYFVYKAKS